MAYQKHVRSRGDGDEGAALGLLRLGLEGAARCAAASPQRNAAPRPAKSERGIDPLGAIVLVAFFVACAAGSGRGHAPRAHSKKAH